MNGKANYYAWFEMYPQWAYELNPSTRYYPVSAGDAMTAEVKYNKSSIHPDAKRRYEKMEFSPTVQTLRSAKEETAEMG